jgi:hypothetical protein
MKTVIEMAREAGFNHHHNPDLYDCMIASDKAIERFAVLLLASTDPQSSMSWQEGNEAGRLAEREACAKLCDDIATDDGFEGGYANGCAAAIRARGQA